MSENASVIVFPSIFAQNKINSLISNIKKILKIKNLKFQAIRKEDSIIVVNANDPVFTSSAINLLFGIERVAIAKQVENEFNTVVSAITKIGSNLLLKGDKFYVKIEGYSTGYLPKDLEIATTSSLIEKTTKLGAKPGTENNNDKVLYTFLTKKHAYVCIYTDKGLGGIPYNSQNEKIVCSIFDELSAISCLETIKQGYDVKIVIFYNKKSELLNLVKILNKIIPRTLHSKIDLDFYQILISSGTKNFLLLVQTITEILITIAKLNKMKKISLSISPLIFPSPFVDAIIKRVFEKNIIPHIPLAGLDDDILDNAKEIGLGKFLPKIERFGKMRFNSFNTTINEAKKIAKESEHTKKSISIEVGANNIHDILDSLELEH
ncbi:MAG: thiamine biosynthesis protein [Nitrosopumilaceae archaeon]